MSLVKGVSDPAIISIPSCQSERVGVAQYLHKSDWVCWLSWFDMIWFYGILTIVGYSMSSQVYSYILDIYDL